MPMVFRSMPSCDGSSLASPCQKACIRVQLSVISPRRRRYCLVRLRPAEELLVAWLQRPISHRRKGRRLAYCSAT
ncbi:hypothetical protein GOP47_0020597 [Adiantum capillus-veneris]|uniref:Uncharacterized protein n=1 Tax=Adiantum capillus-veneris TaxID=13818 RepID=A0A9D4UA98_ADICA|nr:hypothetical protein GOP47_0020597 [Adiantum capillus-veneris]